LHGIFRARPNHSTVIPRVTIKYLSIDNETRNFETTNVTSIRREREVSGDETSPWILIIHGIQTLTVYETSIISITCEPPLYLANTVCFTGDSIVAVLFLGTEETTITLGYLRPGMYVKGADKHFYSVKHVVKTYYNGKIYTVDGLNGTPFHPVVDKLTNTWKFMKDVDGATAKDYSGFVFSLQLYNRTSEGVYINGILCAVLGHGVTSGDSVVAHEYYGNWDRVDADLSEIMADDDGHTCILKVERDPNSGHVCRLIG